MSILEKALVILAALFFFAPRPVKAASLSLAGVADATQATLDTTKRTTKSDSYLTYGAAALLEFDFSVTGLIGTETGLIYFRRRTGYGSALNEVTNWLEVPLVARLHFLIFSLGAGGYYARGIGRVDDGTPAGTTSQGFTSTEERPDDVGLTGAAGIAIPIGVLKLFSDFRYSRSIRNLSKADSYTRKYSDLQLLVGIRF